jgi:hypothetical protein
MPDFNDHASEVEQQTLRDQLEAQKVRAANTPRLRPAGSCLNHRCAEDFPPGDQRVFCDSRCAAEHARNETIFKRQA